MSGPGNFSTFRIKQATNRKVSPKNDDRSGVETFFEVSTKSCFCNGRFASCVFFVNVRDGYSRVHLQLGRFNDSQFVPLVTSFRTVGGDNTHPSSMPRPPISEDSSCPEKHAITLQKDSLLHHRSGTGRIASSLFRNFSVA